VLVSGEDIQGELGVYTPPVRKIRNFVYLISELFRSVRKTCSRSIVRYTNRIGPIAKWTSRR